MCSDTWVETYTFDDSLAVQALYFCVSVELIEVAYTEGEVSVSEKLNGFCFFHTHKQGVDVFLDCSFLQEGSECLGRFFQHLYVGY